MFKYIPINGLIQLLTAFAALAVVAILWKYKKAKEVRYLIYLQIIIAVWATFYGIEFFAEDLSSKILWSKFSYLGIAFLPACYFFFTTAFSQKNKLLNTKNKLLTLIIPIVTLILVFTNQNHHLVWKETTLSVESNMLLYVHGIWFWLFYLYTFLLIISGMYNLFSSIHKFTSFYKSQVIVLLVGSTIPVVANIAYISKINPFPGFDWTTISFVLSGVIISLGVYRYRMFELVPRAKKKLLDIMSEGVLVVNANGLVEDFNPATIKIFGINKKEAFKAPIHKLFENYPNIIEAFYNKEDCIIDIQIGKNKDASYYQVKVSGIVSQKKILSGKLFVVNDVTSIRRAEIKLKNTNKQLVHEIEKNEKLIDDLDSFAHTVAHDLKNSLGSIYSSSEVIIDSIDDYNKEFLKELSLLVKESAGKTIQVTNELLKMATEGHQDVEKVPVKMDAIFGEAEKQLSEIITQNEVKITVPEIWDSALGYAPWIEEVWVNYISNAIKYGGSPAEISVGSEKINGHQIKFWIKDNGNGIAAEQQNKLFVKHCRLDPDKAYGYGLGLSIVKRIVEKLEGTVGVESTGEKGKGSTFYFILPSN